MSEEPDMPHESTPDQFDIDLQKMIETSKELFIPVDLFKSCLNELYTRSLPLYSNQTSEAEAYEINLALEKLEFDITKYLSESYDQFLKSSNERSDVIDSIAKLMIESENIRFSVFDRLFPNCAHCNIDKITPDEYKNLIDEDLEYLDDSSDASSYIMSKNAVLRIYARQTETIIDLATTHLPEYYQGGLRLYLIKKIGNHALDITKIAVGVAAGIEIFNVINDKIN